MLRNQHFNIPVVLPVIPSKKVFFKSVNEILECRRLTNFGFYHDKLQSALENYLNVSNLLLVANGTLALQVAIKTYIIENELKKNILAIDTTPFSFVATTSAAKWLGLKPKFFDIQKNGTIDPSKIDSMRSKLLLATNVYGNSCDTEKLNVLYGEENIIYDSSHCFGVRGSSNILTRGFASTLSFHATKVFSTIEGGAIVFKSKSSFEIAKRIINFGFNDNGNIETVGINAKLSELHAAFGLALMTEVDDFISKRREIAAIYNEHLKSAPVASMVEDTPSHISNFAYYPIVFRTEEYLLQVMSILASQGIQSKRYFYPSLENVFCQADLDSKCTVASDISKRILCLPMYPELNFDEAVNISKLISTK